MEPVFHFHLRKAVRDYYRVDSNLFSFQGHVVFADFHQARTLANKLNSRRDLLHFPETAVKASEIFAIGLIEEIFHYVVRLYHQQVNPHAMERAYQRLKSRIPEQEIEKALLQFLEEFPPQPVYARKVTAGEYLKGQTGHLPNRLIALEEMLMIWLANSNPACGPFVELFDDRILETTSAYRKIIQELKSFFAGEPPFGPDRQNLIDMLETPAKVSPHSLHGQLEFIRSRWGSLLGDWLLKILGGLDFLKEEEKLGLLGPGPAVVYEYGKLAEEPEAFTPDRDWMPQLVLIAKSTYVWLDQLSKKYGRPITRLDQIPDEELDQLARWGFTGLWLIGVWERSRASKKIKQLCGNPEAEASAYSLYDYEIAADLGGLEALQNLKDRAWKRGIRLASDMVPNHMGIDSRWVMEHPEWFIQLDYCPFPSYTFNGPNLSENPRIGIFIEDHYYDRTDAAVVFKWVDFETGQTRYIYHGNDGTSMPWNDTAQLNYLLPEVREAVIQTILHVARLFPIIRFDAAMTLTKLHYQRLWFPEPGKGGDIPSRAEHGMTRAQFDAHMPREFWREVVDRVASEAPDTLLLAEAFWLMEGYFVRTLGMHRVYNSAFMNMLKSEKNAEYRQLLKNTLEFDPEILRRFVNFMNNPDEETAVVQFGKGDKYFGVCTMMVTMPGLPMFGHGQVEGFAEKYGMEYRRAYWDEQPDLHLIERHEQEIFPLMRKRHLFAGVENFLLYDFFDPSGRVNEDVFAYSNRSGEERALVVYHNRYAHTAGWIRTSVAFATKNNRGEKQLIQKSLGDGLALPDDPKSYCIFRDHRSGLEFLRNCKEIHEKGLYVELGAYQYHVFLDFRIVKDDPQQSWSHLYRYLGGRGVPSIDQARKELFLQPLHQAFHSLCSAEKRKLWQHVSRHQLVSHKEEGKQLIRRFLVEAANRLPESRTEHIPQLEKEIWSLLENAVALLDDLDEKTRRTAGRLLIPWVFLCRLGKLVEEENFEERTCSLIEEWLLAKELNWNGEEQLQEADEIRILFRLLVRWQRWYRALERSLGPTSRLLNQMFSDLELQRWLHVNRYQNILWFSKERFEEWTKWLDYLATVQNTATKARDYRRMLETWRKAAETARYQVDRFLAQIQQEG